MLFGACPTAYQLPITMASCDHYTFLSKVNITVFSLQHNYEHTLCRRLLFAQIVTLFSCTWTECQFESLNANLNTSQKELHQGVFSMHFCGKVSLWVKIFFSNRLGLLQDCGQTPFACWLYSSHHISNLKTRYPLFGGFE